MSRKWNADVADDADFHRLKRFPASPHEDLFVAWLRAGVHTVISHDSALALYDLSDLLPNEIHLTVQGQHAGTWNPVIWTWES